MYSTYFLTADTVNQVSNNINNLYWLFMVSSYKFVVNTNILLQQFHVPTILTTIPQFHVFICCYNGNPMFDQNKNTRWLKVSSVSPLYYFAYLKLSVCPKTFLGHKLVYWISRVEYRLSLPIWTKLSQILTLVAYKQTG